MWPSEPATLVTDWLITICALIFALRLVSSGRFQRFSQLWRTGFVAIALAAFLGGAFHGFPDWLGSYRLRVWDATVFLIGAGSAFMIAAATITPAPAGSEARRWLLLGLLVTISGMPVLVFKWGLHPAFNHNDVYHCIQLVGLYFLYRGVLAASTI